MIEDKKVIHCEYYSLQLPFLFGNWESLLNDAQHMIDSCKLIHNPTGEEMLPAKIEIPIKKGNNLSNIAIMTFTVGDERLDFE